MTKFAVKEHAIYQTVDSYAKIYDNFTKVIKYNKPIKIRVSGFESVKKKMRSRVATQSNNPLYLIESIRRTKTRLSDIVLSNKFDLFCTFTFDPKKTDRHNVELCKKRMSKWLDNQNARVGKFKYLIVPERHKDGALHFHALFKSYSGELVNSGHFRKDGRIVYNISGWKWGFSTATKIDDAGIPLVSSYVKKYITKDMPQFNNKQRYWCSKGLVRPKKVLNPVVFDYSVFDSEYQSDSATFYSAKHRIELVSADSKGTPAADAVVPIFGRTPF